MADRTYAIVISGSARPYVQELDRAARATMGWAGQVERAGNVADKGLGRASQAAERSNVGFSRAAVAAEVMGFNLRGAAMAAAGFFAGAVVVRGLERLGRGLVQAVISGSNLTETYNKGEVVFGRYADVVVAGADEMADRFGVSRQAFIDGASSIGLILNQAGLARPIVAGLSKDFADLAADVTSLLNVPTVEVLDAIRSGLVGESEPLRRFGVDVRETAVDLEALQMGLGSTGRALTEQERVQARVSIIMRGLSVASGDLERTQDSLANRLRAMQGHVANWAAEMGQRAAPAILDVLDASYRLGRGGLEVLADAGERLEPFFSDLVETGGNLVGIFDNVWDAAGPLVGGFAALAGTALIQTLNVLGGSLAAVTGFLEQNEWIVNILVAAYGTKLVMAIVRASAAFASASFDRAAIGLFNAAGAADRLAASLGVLTLRAGLVGAALFVGTQILGDYMRRKAEATAMTQQFTDALYQEGDAARIAAEDIILKTLADKGLLALASQVVGTRDLIDAIMGEADARDRASEAIDRYVEQQLRTHGLFSDEANAALALANTYDDLAGTHDDGEKKATSRKDAEAALGREVRDGTSAVDAYGDAVSSAITPVEELTAAQKALQGALQSLSGLSFIEEAEQEKGRARSQSAKATKTAEQREIDYLQALYGTQRAGMRVADAQRAVNEAREDALSMRQVTQAERDLERALQGTERATWDVIDATRALEDARRAAVSGRDVREAELARERALDAVASATDTLAIAELKLAAARDHGTEQEVAESEREAAEARRRLTETGWEAQDAEVALARAQEDAVSGGRAVAEAQAALSAAHLGVGDAASQAADAERALEAARAGADTVRLRESELDLAEAVLGVRSAQEQLREAMSDTSAQEAQSSANRDVVLSFEELMAAYRRSIDAQLNFKDNLDFVARTGPPGMVARLAEMGEKGIAVAQELRGRTPAELREMFSLMNQDAIYGSSQWAKVLTDNVGTGRRLTVAEVTTMVGEMRAELGVSVEDATRILSQYVAEADRWVLPVLEKYGYVPNTYRNEFAGTATPGGGRVGLAAGGIVDLLAGGGMLGKEKHVAQIARAGDWRVWAEPETGGEAYVPLAADWRRPRAQQVWLETGRRIGMVEDYAAGGLRPPERSWFAEMPWATASPAEAHANALFAASKRGLASAGGLAPGALGNLVAVAHTLQQLFGVRISEHPAFGGVHAVHTPTSWHYKGRAIDVNYGPGGQSAAEMARLDQVAAWIRGNLRPLELLWRTKGHFDHLHLAMAQGGILNPWVRDQGGPLMPGFTYNGTGAPETVYGPLTGRPPMTMGATSYGGVRVQMVPGMVQVDVHVSADADVGVLAKVTERAVAPAIERFGADLLQKVIALQGGN